MSFESNIALRYLKARRSVKFVSTITLISVCGVAVGVCALIVVLSVMGGFAEELRDKIIGTNAHGNVLKSVYGFTEYRETAEKVLSVPGVTAAAPFLLREVMVSSQRNMSGALIKGIDIESAQKVTDIKGHIEAAGKNSGKLEYLNDPESLLKDTQDAIEKEIEEGKLMREFSTRTKNTYGDKVLPAIVLGKEMAKYLGVGVGDEVNLVNPVGGGLGPTGPIPSSRYFRVGAIFYSGMFEYDMKFCYTTLKDLQELSDIGDEATGIEFKVKPELVYETDRIGEQILEALGRFPYNVRDWKEINRNLFAALELERIAMFVILTFIILVAAFNILSTLIMMVLDKNKEISILKSMGASNLSVMKIFMIDGIIVGAVGTLAGTLLGLLLCALIPILDFKLDQDIYYMANLPVKVQPLQVGLIILCALFISWLATLYPAWQAARTNPVDGLRNE